MSRWLNTVKNAAFAVAAPALSSGASASSLEKGFRNPPVSARPHTWYHLMNGNATKEGGT